MCEELGGAVTAERPITSVGMEKYSSDTHTHTHTTNVWDTMFCKVRPADLYHVNSHMYASFIRAPQSWSMKTYMHLEPCERDAWHFKYKSNAVANKSFELHFIIKNMHQVNIQSVSSGPPGAAQRLTSVPQKQIGHMQRRKFHSTSCMWPVRSNLSHSIGSDKIKRHTNSSPELKIDR